MAMKTRKGYRVQSAQLFKQRAQTMPLKDTSLLVSTWVRRKKNKAGAQSKQVSKARSQPEQPNHAAILKLPVEIVVSIIARLDTFGSARSLSLTCRQMHAIFSANLKTIYKKVAASGLELRWPKQARQLRADLKGHDLDGPLTPEDLGSILRTERTLKAFVQNMLYPVNGTPLITHDPRNLLPPLPPHAPHDFPITRLGAMIPIVPPSAARDYVIERTMQRLGCRRKLTNSALFFYYILLSLIVIPKDAMIKRVHGMKLRQLALLENFAWRFDLNAVAAVSSCWEYKESLSKGTTYDSLRYVHQVMEELLCHEYRRWWVEHMGPTQWTVEIETMQEYWHANKKGWILAHGYMNDGTDIWGESREDDEFEYWVYEYWGQRDLRIFCGRRPLG